MVNIIKLPQTIQQAYVQKSELEKLLLWSCGLSILFNSLRTVHTGEPQFFFLLWNLFLAAIPYFISRNLIRTPQWIENNLRFAFAAICWVLFVPNSFYIITDLFHLRERVGVPLWFDLALIFSYAWNGLLLGVLSVRQMEKVVMVKFSLRYSWAFIAPVMALNALGIFIGRYLRYNSWDVLTNPFALARDIGHLIIHPLRNFSDWSMIGCFTLLLLAVYSSLKQLSKAVW